MKPLRPLTFFCSLAALTSCAEVTYRADVGAMFPVARGDLALQNSAGTLSLDGSKNRLGSNLGLGETDASPYVHLQADKERHRFRLNGFYSNTEGTGTLARSYGDLAAGSVVTTSMDFYTVQATYAFQVLRDDHWRLAFGGTLGAYGLDVGARSTAGRESVHTSLLVPMPYVEAEAFIGQLIVGGDAAIMVGDFGDGHGWFGDVEAYVKARPIADFELFAGYRYVLLDAAGVASSRRFDSEIDVRGFFFGGGVRF